MAGNGASAPVHGLNIKIRPALRQRLNECAALEGVTTGEFARAAILAHCERAEAAHERRALALPTPAAEDAP